MIELTAEKRAELRAACDRYASQPGFVGIGVDRKDLLSLLDALDAAEAKLAELKRSLRKFAPSARDDKYCRNCEELYQDHYSGPFAEPDTLYCSKYFVPRGPR